MKNVFKNGLVFSIVLIFFLTALSVLDVAAQVREKKIDINTASSVELQKLPRVGVKVAQRIIDYRKTNGLFKRIEELMKVKGIGEKTYAQLKDLITVGAPSEKK